MGGNWRQFNRSAHLQQHFFLRNFSLTLLPHCDDSNYRLKSDLLTVRSTITFHQNEQQQKLSRIPQVAIAVIITSMVPSHHTRTHTLESEKL